MARSFSPLAVLLLPFAVGCGEASPAGQAGISFDPCQALAVAPAADMTAAEADGVRRGIAFWNGIAHSRLSVVGQPQAAAVATLPIHFQSAAAPFHGFYDRQTGQVFINKDLGAAERAITIAHEIGHAFGLAHAVAGRPSVMRAGNLDVAPTDGDVADLAVLWGACSVDPGQTVP